MTKEEKELLLKDLCARLPYGVIVNYKEYKYDNRYWKITTLHAPDYSINGTLINTDNDGWISYKEYKGCGMSTGSRTLQLEKHLPYLRPMSSMTEEEWVELGKIANDGEWIVADFYYSHHIDCWGLIPKGLALIAPKGMYNLNEE